MTIITRSPSILSRAFWSEPASFSPLQSQVDGLVSHFVDEAANPITLVAMTMGGFAYRMGRVGVMGMHVGAYCNTPLRVASIAVGLGSEVTAFELTNRTLQTVGANLVFAPREGRSQGSPLPENLWSWSGPGGWREGLLNSLITFGMLKGAGHLARGQNLIFQHAFQSTAMVAGHNLSGAMGIIQTPEGGLAEQLLHAEATNLQLGAGMSLVHSMTPGIAAWERGMDLSLHRQEGNDIRRRWIQEALSSTGLRLEEQTLVPVEQAFPIRNRSRTLENSLMAMMSGGGKDRGMGVENGNGSGNGNGGSPGNGDGARVPLYYYDNGGFIEVLDRALERLKQTQRCLRIEVGSLEIRGIRELVQRLKDRSHLQEIQLHFVDGSVAWYLKEGETIVQEREDPSPGRGLATESAYKTGEVYRIRMVPPWRPSASSSTLAAFLRSLRDQMGMTRPEVSRRMVEVGLGSLHPDTLKVYETEGEEIPSFQTLELFSKFYGVDIRPLIYLSNLRFPEIDPKHWMTPYYPLLIENNTDRERIEFYQKTDPNHSSLGWLLFSTRKNPFQYFRKGEWARATGLSADQLGELEQNNAEPHFLTLKDLARVAGIDESRMIQAINETFHRGLLPLMERLFPNQILSLDLKSEDPEKIRYYADHPESLGRVIFGARKSMKGYPSNLDLSQQIGRHEGYVNDREWDQVNVTPSNLWEWVWFLKRIGLDPKEHLLPRLAPHGITGESPRYLLAEAMEGLSQNELAEKAGIKPDAIISMLNREHPEVRPETLLSLRRALPRLDPRFFRAIIPKVVKFFPELLGDAPQLRLSQKQIREASRLDLGALLFAYRMDHQLSRAQLGERLGVSGVPIKNIEAGVTNVEEDALLFAAARLLKVDRKLLYLRYRPHLLELFSSAPSLQGEAQGWEGEWPRNDSGLLRLQLWQSLRQRGITTPEGFAQFLKLKGTSSVRRYLHAYALNLEEILTLKRQIPEISARDWYEHFHRSILVYFLGQKEDGSVNYDLPEGMSWETLKGLDPFSRIQEAIPQRFSSPQEAARLLDLTFLGKEHQLRGVLKGRWREETIAQVANGLGISRRLLFFYFRQEELRQVLESDQPSP